MNGRWKHHLTKVLRGSHSRCVSRVVFLATELDCVCVFCAYRGGGLHALAAAFADISQSTPVKPTRGSAPSLIPELKPSADPHLKYVMCLWMHCIWQPSSLAQRVRRRLFVRTNDHIVCYMQPNHAQATLIAQGPAYRRTRNFLSCRCRLCFRTAVLLRRYR